MRIHPLVLSISMTIGMHLVTAGPALADGGPPLDAVCTAEPAQSSAPLIDNPNTILVWDHGNLTIYERVAIHAGEQEDGVSPRRGRRTALVEVGDVPYDPRSICEKREWVGCGASSDNSDAGSPGSGGVPGGGSSNPEGEGAHPGGGNPGRGGSSGAGSSRPTLTAISEPTCGSITVTENGIQCVPTCPAPLAGATVPCMGIIREPYPRGLVTAPNTFTLTGPYTSEAAPTFCPRPDGEYPSIMNASLKIAWEMRMDTQSAPVWDFDERPWNIARGAPNHAFGFVVQHIYDTASHSTFEGDKPFNGPGLTGEPLSAYQVSVRTLWTPYLVREWDAMGFDDNGEYVVVGHVARKDRIDLTQWGYPTSDFVSNFARDLRAPPYEPYRCNIPTPIVEVQAVLTNP